ncbi:MAG: hypothetical protein MK138_01235 [Planctomycetes bacterium]|nr:hypothetical protein [Planctomycetota bacterium]
MPPQVKLESSEQSALDLIDLENLKAFAAKPQ